MDILQEVRALERKKDYRAARELIEPALADDPADDRLRGRMAVCTYKDPDLPVERRLGDALRVLTARVAGIPEDLTDQDLLGIAGAIFKRRWEVGSQESYLHRSLALYRRGARLGVSRDQGYTAINVAFVCDLLADIEQRQDPQSSQPAGRRTEADTWRNDVVDCLKPQLERGELPSWWPLVTIVEALIGLGRAGEAGPWAAQAGALRERATQEEGPLPWEVETTARQIAAVARLRFGTDRTTSQTSAASERLREIIGANSSAAVESAWTGKVGLALSGGGFRASLFHIGVLARLAELDVLRRIEVLSCVSGGSILGAYYYLKAREELNAHADPRPDRDDYLTLVTSIQEDFVAAIGANLRMRLLTDPRCVLKMAISRTYSRTERVADLCQRLLYSPLGNDDWRLPGLLVTPPDAGAFEPKHDNWRRSSKVPVLVLNATTMNTGHNWQFTATWMGEPPSAIDEDVDSADRLRRVYHREAPPDHASMPLGRAVAASAAVPGMFPPVTLRGLYPDVTVRLSDGGAHDNQGIASLVEQDCSVILVSDASGQGKSIVKPNDRAVPILSRTLSIAMARVRHEQYRGLAARRSASSLRKLMFVHLKQDLPHAEITWITGKQTGPPASAAQLDAGTSAYGIRLDVQRRLASIRTDLDAFHKHEAYALMASGYRMVDHAFSGPADGLPTTSGRHPWRFCALQEAMQGGAGHEELLDKLGRSDKRFFKWFAWPGALVLILGIVLVASAAAGLVAVDAIGGTTWVVVVLVAIVAATIACAVPDDHLLVYLVTLAFKLPLGLIAMVAAPLLAWPYLWIFNRLYLRRGDGAFAAQTWREPPEEE